jgi:integrase/recombinase XerD
LIGSIFRWWCIEELCRKQNSTIVEAIELSSSSCSTPLFAVRVSELVNIRVSEIDLDGCKIFVENGKGNKDRYILFPSDFRLALQTYMESHQDNEFLFESRLRQPYTPRRVQQIMRIYANKAGLTRAVHPHLLRHQMLTFLTAQGLTDAKIQLISGHGNRKSLELYQHLSLAAIEGDYQKAVRNLEI